jgi:hypothetical protein
MRLVGFLFPVEQFAELIDALRDRADVAGLTTEQFGVGGDLRDWPLGHDVQHVPVGVLRQRSPAIRGRVTPRCRLLVVEVVEGARAREVILSGLVVRKRKRRVERIVWIDLLQRLGPDHFATTRPAIPDERSTSTEENHGQGR